VQKFVLQLEAQLDERQINIELSEDAADWLAREGYDEQMGARPLSRVIQKYVKQPLADEVLFGKLKGGGTVRVLLGKDAQGLDELKFTYLSRDEEKALPKPEARKSLPPAKKPAAKKKAKGSPATKAAAKKKPGGPKDKKETVK
jgi:ATP-dependent Clp protease ATP-binding subunit ClpA